MKVLIDTNVIIDVLEHREPFFPDSYRIIQLSLQAKLDTFMSAGAVTDVYYVINRSIHDADKTREKIIALNALINVCDTTALDIKTALTFNIPDFEDAVVAAIAKREKADYIVSRNEDDFVNSSVPAMNPKRFLGQFFES
jgi:predicted nucleic acid-binding protein